MGATVTDEMKDFFNEKHQQKQIFEQMVISWRGLFTRTAFPDKYDTLKAYIMNEYTSQMTQVKSAKII
jgi:hypothetical protein